MLPESRPPLHHACLGLQNLRQTGICGHQQSARGKARQSDISLPVRSRWFSIRGKYLEQVKQLPVNIPDHCQRSTSYSTDMVRFASGVVRIDKVKQALQGQQQEAKQQGSGTQDSRGGFCTRNIELNPRAQVD